MHQHNAHVMMSFTHLTITHGLTQLVDNHGVVGQLPNFLLYNSPLDQMTLSRTGSRDLGVVAKPQDTVILKGTDIPLFIQLIARGC